MKNYLKVDNDNLALVMDKTFKKNSQIVGSREYILLQGARKDYPGYKEVTRQIKKNTQQEHYHGLTYEFMENYILDHEPRATKNKVHDEFREMIDISKCHSRRYPVIKAWFLEQYPEIKQYGTQLIQNVSVIENALEMAA